MEQETRYGNPCKSAAKATKLGCNRKLGNLVKVQLGSQDCVEFTFYLFT